MQQNCEFVSISYNFLCKILFCQHPQPSFLSMSINIHYCALNTHFLTVFGCDTPLRLCPNPDFQTKVDYKHMDAVHLTFICVVIMEYARGLMLLCPSKTKRDPNRKLIVQTVSQYYSPIKKLLQNKSSSYKVFQATNLLLVDN